MPTAPMQNGHRTAMSASRAATIDAADSIMAVSSSSSSSSISASAVSAALPLRKSRPPPAPAVIDAARRPS